MKTLWAVGPGETVKALQQDANHLEMVVVGLPVDDGQRQPKRDG